MDFNSEDDLIPISALSHLIYCERRFALVHIEQLWEENRYTAEGQVLHERVDTEGHESRRLFRQEFAMALRSLEYGIIGKADLLEFYLSPEGGVAEAVPVEFKRGKDKESDCDRVQLCAQALCLEEMLHVAPTRGAFYYLGAHRRTNLEFSAQLRAQTIAAIARSRAILDSEKTPAAKYEKAKCDRCSLVELCMPDVAGNGGKRVARYIESEIAITRKECS